MVYKKGSLEDFAKSETVWGKRAEGLPEIGFDLGRTPTKDELAYLHQKYSFIQIVNPGAQGEYSEIRFLRAPSGWLIFFYKNAMAASPGEGIFTDDVYTSQGDEVTQVCTGTGTRIKQIIDTASELVRIAKEEKWTGIHVIDGTPLMSWGVWKAAKELGMEVTGYVPSIEEEAKYERIQKNCPSLILSKTPSPKG